MRRIRWGVAVACALALAVVVPSSATAQPIGKPPGPARPVGQPAGPPPAGFASWAEVMGVQSRLDAAADRITAAKDGDFAGVVVAPEKRRMTVYWKGAPSARAGQAIAAERRGVRVDLASAPYSQDELVAEASRLVKAGAVTTAGPAPDGSGLTVSRPTDARLAPPASTYPLVETAASPALTSRLDDSTPYWGGSRWNGCSTGFGIRIGTNPGYTQVLSAGHCANNQDYAYDGGGQQMGRVNGDSDLRDRLLINAAAAGRVFNGTPGTNEFTNAVIGSYGSRVGDYVCTSGAYSGTVCNIRVTAIYQTLNVGYNIEFLVLAEQLSHLAAAGNGDSGGPVEQVAADTTKVYAKGTLTAIDNGTIVPCPGIPSDPSRACGWRFWYEPIDLSMAAYGAYIVTG